MPDPLLPAVTVDEALDAAWQIPAVPTSIIGMVGLTECGPVDRPVLVTSFAAFQRVFGGFQRPEGDPVPRNHLVHAVKGAFDMGAQRLYVTRVLGPRAAVAKVALPGLPLQVQALHPGQWGNRLRVAVDPLTRAFSLTVELLDTGDRVVLTENYDSLVLDPAQPRHAPLVLQQSALVRLSERPPDPGPLTAVSCALTGGGDDLSGLNDDSYIGAPAGRATATGLQTLADLDEIGMIAIPGQTSLRVQAAMIAQCEAMRYRMAILDSTPEASIGEVLAQGRAFDSCRAALYYPWLEVDDPLRPGLGRVFIPPSGHICGAIAKTDTDRGTHKAPANIALQSVLGVQRRVTSAEQDHLNPNGINVIRDFMPERKGIRIWGARTLSSDPQWKYIPVRRLLFSVEKSIAQGLRFAVFEPQSPLLWSLIRRLTETFLQMLWRNGSFAGAKMQQAFFVRVGPEVMTQDDIDAGRLIVEIGVAPLRPAEFVMFRIVIQTNMIDPNFGDGQEEGR